MVPLGVETSTAVATAAEGVAPGSFLDGLLAALNALTTAPTTATGTTQAAIVEPASAGITTTTGPSMPHAVVDAKPLIEAATNAAAIAVPVQAGSIPLGATSND